MPPIFETEAAMCLLFAEWARRQGWESYAETGGYDLVLVHGDGTQIGVQAKLRFNLKVLEQILPEDFGWRGPENGPDYRAILIPEVVEGSRKITGSLGITLFYSDRWNKGDFYPEIAQKWDGWTYWNPKKRVALPSHVPDVVPGASGPSQLTEWKIAALRIVATLEIRGYVTAQDFKDAGIDQRRWLNYWVVPNGVRGQWKAAPDLAFAAQHPQVYPKVLEEVREALARVERLPGV